MTRARRLGLSVMASFVFAELYISGCSGARVTPAQAVQLDVLAVATDCKLCPVTGCGDKSVDAICAAFAQAAAADFSQGIGGQTFVAPPVAGGGLGGQ